ncbi:MAG: YsnF/AvaK domain-containing protein, partial [Gemmatimonadales bacterium]|nr:YsnF/AvaK domain-containing protein [Gemmatimonadales bacterium]
MSNVCSVRWLSNSIKFVRSNTMALMKESLQSGADGSTVVGLFEDQPSAEQAIQRLKAEGFSEQQIGVAVRDRAQQQALTESTGTQAAEGATKGAVGGGVVGGVVGLLAGVGALAIPGIGPIIAGGALASTLAGAGIGAAAGGLMGALVGMGIPENDARHFEQGFQEGGVLVTVQAGARSGDVRRVLHESGADLGSMGLETARPAAVTEAEGGAERLELREEQLDLKTRQVQAGEVRLRKEVVTENRNIEVPVTREEVVIERHPVSGREASDQTLDDNEEVRIPLMEEEVDVRKRAVVREEVSVGKRKVQE